jgi:PAS domain S-box-containing protein
MSVAKIMVVEDEWLVAQGIKESLEDLGYEVVGLAATGEEALQSAALHRPDLVLMDILLKGGMDGIEVATRLRRDFEVPALFLTAYADSQTLGRAKMTEPYGYLLKPFEARELHSAVEIALYKSQAEKKLKHLNQVLRAIRSIGQLIVQEKDRDLLIQRACQLLTEGRGYFTAWLVLLDEAGRLTTSAAAGKDDNLSRVLPLLQQGRMPACGRRSLEQGGLLVTVPDLAADCTDCFWCGHSQDRGALVIGLAHQGVVYGLLGVQLPTPLVVDAEEVLLFRELAADLSLALYKMDLEDREQQALRNFQASENKYRQIVETANEGIWVIDENFCTTFVNPQMAALLGYTPEEILGQPTTTFLFPEDVAGHLEMQAQRQAGKASIYERRLRTKDGREVWTLVSGTPVFDGSGRFQGSFGMFMDITERKRAEVERLKIDKLEALGVLAGGIAHDLNNVLMGILGNISLATGALSVSEIKARLAAAETACGQAQSLASQLLTFAKGGGPIKQLQDLKEIIHEAGRLAVCGSMTRMDFSLPEHLWGVEVDRGQMHQVFSNLFINAIQSMPLGGVIQVQADNRIIAADSGLALPPGKYVAVTLADHGEGITHENLKKIFDPYFTTKQKGSGLGLATVYAIVSQHGGAITVASRLGQGTTFRLWLPAAEGVLSTREPAEIQPLNGHGRILVMDDDLLVREVVGKMLRKLGYEPVFAQEGEEALAIYTQGQNTGDPFAAVILDLTIPGGMGGMEAIQHLLVQDPQARALVSSGYSDHPIMASYQDYGFQGVIAKPYKISGLSEVLQKVIVASEEEPAAD